MKGNLYLLYLSVVLFIIINPVYSQQAPANDIEEIHNSQLEDLSETTESESEDDHILQQLSYFLRHPININSDRETLAEFPLFDDLMINHLLSYRKLLGNLISVYELQAVPGFSIEEIKSMLPYITVANHSLSNTSILKRFTGRDHSLIVRPTLVPEIMNGFLKDQPANQSFIGSRPALFIRYKYQYADLLKFTFLIDKDAGEKLFSGRKIALPDFYSFNFTINKAGLIQSLIIGDYSINIGQGLMHWQSQAFKKSAGVISIKRQSTTLRPYHAAGEYNFMRGFAATLRSGNLETTLFASARKLSANIGFDSTYGPAITSVITSGLHRTPSELADRSTTRLMAVGGSFKRSGRMGHAALNAIGYQYSLPLVKRNEAYNLYAIKGKRWFNCSFDYSFTYRNFHFFGEMAFDKIGSHAIINGMMGSLNSSIDLSILHRAIASSYQSLFGNAFTENTLPTNEHGIYNGVSIRPHHHWKIDLYADLFSFPWLRYRVDAPSKGFQYLFQLTWKPGKNLEVYSRFRYRMKSLNVDDEADIRFVEGKNSQNWRSHINFQASKTILLRSRVEVCLTGKSTTGFPQSGYLYYTDALFKPSHKNFSGNARLQVFETDGYDTRIYAYENDLLYISSTPAFFKKGIRYYLNLKATFPVKCLGSRELIVSFKVASTVYKNNVPGESAVLAVAGARKSDVRLQLLVLPAM